VLPVPFAYTLLPALASLAFAALAPLAVGRFFAWVYLAGVPRDRGDEPLAAFQRAMSTGEIACVGLAVDLAGRAFAPWLAGSARIPLSIGLGLLAWAVAIGAGAIPRARVSAPDAHMPWARAAGARVRRIVKETANLFRGHLRLGRGGVLGWAVAFTLVALVTLAREAPDIAPADARETSETEALVALAASPSDGEAMLALAWRAREAGALGLAEVRANAARAAGADEEALHVARAEIAAARGHCDEARAELRASIEAQAARRFADGADAELVLGGYALPPTLVRECDVSVGEAFGGPL
jgi:hypothetical protein